jgi:hypothetical protein
MQVCKRRRVHPFIHPFSILLFPPPLQQRNHRSESLRIDSPGHPIRGRSMLYPLSVVTGILADWMIQKGIHCALFTGMFRAQDQSCDGIWTWP